MKPTKPLLIGAHFSIAGGLERALLHAETYGCPVLQLFTKNANTWKERTLSAAEIERFKRTRKELKIVTAAAHTAYLINLASPEKKTFDLSVKALEQELIRSSLLGIEYVVLHPGAHKGSGEMAGIRRIAAAVHDIFDRHPNLTAKLLLETTAGQGTVLGCTFEQLAEMRHRIDAGIPVGICLDTAHVFAAGYDLRDESAYENTWEAFDRIIGMAHLNLVHLNDTKKPFASKVDRHEHIGEGFLGLKTFEMIVNDPRLERIPKILETPKEAPPGKDWDKINIKRLRALVRG